MTKPLTPLALALLMLAGCDPSDRRDVRNEHRDRLYQAALADYRAGRVDAAADGFGAAVRADPSNAEARFQLACLLHDAKKDPLGAFCAYREYLAQRPDGDKAALAKRRMAVCERELAAILAEKHKLLAGRSASDARDPASAHAAKARVSQLEKELAEANRRLAAAADERARLMAVIKGGNAESTVASARPSIKDVKSLLDDDEEGSPPAIADEVAELRREESAESVLGTSLLAPRTAEETEALKAAGKTKEGDAGKSPAHPETYEVQEGDTLYKIAVRFYGSIRAWRKIRDANKALISTDGRVQAGDTIRLP